MLKKIIFFDDGKLENFFTNLLSATSEKGIAIEKVRPKSLVIHWSADEKKMHFYADENELDFGQCYFLPRRTGKVAKPIMGLLFLYAKLNRIPHDDAWRERHVRVNKSWELMMLSQNGIPYPESFICTKTSFESNRTLILSKITFPVVVKGEGSKGNAVWKVNSEAELIACCEAIETPFLIQKYIQNLFDIRICLYKGKVLWAIKRSSADGFYNNTSRGGQREIIEVSQAEIDVAIKAASVIGVDLAGVDLVRTDNGPYVFEVNSAPSLDQTSEYLGINVGEEVVSRLLEDRVLEQDL